MFNFKLHHFLYFLFSTDTNRLFVLYSLWTFCTGDDYLHKYIWQTMQCILIISCFVICLLLSNKKILSWFLLILSFYLLPEHKGLLTIFLTTGFILLEDVVWKWSFVFLILVTTPDPNTNTTYPPINCKYSACLCIFDCMVWNLEKCKMWLWNWNSQ